ncbi:hypothetical protein IW261DRAFT_1559837 [Armillaria novae-zelandiae]|uniref:DUF6534 domain-containing protein n=1 Tax=Armillaria novae-zelandiae TaxID=153914 RepID=A0AA39PLC0_9AGAR|nr:hypothetical protein IW261DRAFT_1559837 [Armillaria novae-zelandiae]
MQRVPAGYPIQILSRPSIVAGLLHWGLFGTLSVQLYLYYLAFPNDRQFIKYLVYGTYIVEFVQTMLLTRDGFVVFVYGFGDIENIQAMHSFWLTGPIMSAVAAFVGQGFYAYRIFILSKSQIIPILVTCVSLIGSVAAIITGVYSFQAGNDAQLQDRKMSVVVAASAALCDVVIAICMTYYLMRCDTSFRLTRVLLTRLICLTVETGSVTAAVALLNIILFLAFPHKCFYVTPVLVMPKLYANTVYMVLNSRIQIVGGRDTYTSTPDMITMTGSTMIPDTNSYSPPGTHGRQGRIGRCDNEGSTQW